MIPVNQRMIPKKTLELNQTVKRFDPHLYKYKLSPFKLSELETYLFSNTEHQLLLNARNFIINKWLESPSQRLNFKDILKLIDLSVLNINIFEKVFHYLNRYRYINYGVFLSDNGSKSIDEKMDTTLSIKHEKKTRIVIVGAGMAGLSTAREIMNLFPNTPNSTVPQPEIIILEGRFLFVYLKYSNNLGKGMAEEYTRFLCIQRQKIQKLYQI